MADGFSERYGDLLYGGYDCVDRIVLNAFNPLCHGPGGFRVWWRRLHGDDEQLDNAQSMRMAGRFARRVRAFAAAEASRWWIAAGVNASTGSLKSIWRPPPWVREYS